MASSSPLSPNALDILRRVTDLAQADAAGDSVAHAQLLNELHNLRMAVESPAEKTMRMRFQTLENLCIRVALEYGILQALEAQHGQPITAAELSKQTGADELLIVRIMRKITYVGVANEIAFATYASNDTTKHITQKGLIAAEKHHTDLTFPVGSKLVELIRKKQLYQFPSEPGEKSPFAYTFGKPIFDYLYDDAEQKEAFDDYMAARRDPSMPQWFEVYPVAQQLADAPPVDNSDTLIVDVGGGLGHEIGKFKKAHPNLPGRFVLEDLPLTLKGLVDPPAGVELVSHDFFTPQPIKGARFYFMRNIMHDWPDRECATILSQIVQVMDPVHSRILIDDYVLPDTGADSRSTGMDILMFMFASGIERSHTQWDRLLKSVNLEIVKVWWSKTGSESVLEAKVRSTTS